MIHLHKIKKAFTMIELVFAIIIIGILASLAMPRIDRDLINEASTNILADIRYTQHLALMDNKHRFDNPNWQQRWWKIMFGTCAVATNKFYMIGSDENSDGAGFFANNESAIDSTNNLPMFWTNGVACPNGGNGTVSDRIFITDKYGITNVVFADAAKVRNNARSCAVATHIGFDHLGRPHQGFGGSDIPNYASYLSQDCDITFTMSTDADGDGANDTFTIRITAETGYAFILNQPDS